MLCGPQEGFTAEDDAGAGGDDDYRREDMDEEEAAIKEMLEKAREAAEVARQRALTGGCYWVCCGCAVGLCRWLGSLHCMVSACLPPSLPWGGFHGAKGGMVPPRQEGREVHLGVGQQSLGGDLDC